MTQKYTIRRLEVGETTQPGTDIACNALREVHLIEGCYSIDKEDRPHYRITPSPEPGKVESVPAFNHDETPGSVFYCRGNTTVDIFAVIQENEKLQAERDKLKSELEELQAELAEARNEIASDGQLRGELKEEIAQLRTQLAAKAEQPTQYAWRDARPEDVGKGLRCRVRDSLDCDWRDEPKRKFLRENDTRGGSGFFTTYDSGIGTIWYRFCQVFAPVEAANEPQDDWRELSKGDQYSGPGQVSDNGVIWRDANIVYIDKDDGCPPFVAKLNDGMVKQCFAFRRARVKGGSRD